MIIYDKARWQIEGGIPEETVKAHFRFMFDWLEKHALLNEYGLRTLRDGIDEEAVLTEEMLNDNGKMFLEKYYDTYVEQIKYGIDEKADLLEALYQKMQA